MKTHTPLLPLEQKIEQAALLLALNYQTIRQRSIEDLMIVIKYSISFLPSRDYYHHNFIKSRDILLERCWKCKGRLVRKGLGWYCPCCSRYRRRKLNILHWKRQDALEWKRRGVSVSRER